MKKLLLSLVLLGGAIIGADAQLTFLLDNEPLASGSVIDFEGYKFANGMLEVTPPLELVSGKTANVTVNAKANEEVQLCLGIQCKSSKDVTVQDKMIAGEAQDLQFHYMKYIGMNVETVEVPAITAVITAYYDDDPDNAITITVNMGGELANAGVESLVANGAGIYVNGKTLNYDLNGASEINVYSLSGKALISRSVAGSGSISLGSLPKGVYVYRVNGKAAKTGKFIIK